MDRNSIIWVLECCMLSLDGTSKKDLKEFGASEEETEIGITLCSYLKNKELAMEIKNGV